MNNLFRSVARFMFGKLLPRTAYPVIRGPLSGAKFVLGSLAGEGGGASVYFDAVEPEQTLAFANILDRGQTFFDIGANVGYYTILGSRLVGPQGIVVAFEPVIRNLALLYRHVSLNRSYNVSILAVACSDTSALATFSLGENDAMGHLASKNNEEENLKSKTTVVPTVSLDTVVQHLGILPDIIKIDVEGAELLVLKGATNTLLEAKPKIFLSVHSEALKATCLEYLGERGYVFEALNHRQSKPTEFLAMHQGELHS